MKGSTHMIAGTCVGLLLASEAGMGPTGAVATTALATFGALFPDLDNFTSRIGRICAPASLAIQLIFGHRTILHSPVFYLAGALAVNVAYPQYSDLYLAFLAGAVSHLFLDMMNPAGIPLLFPARCRFSIAPLKSGGLTDCFLSIFLSILCGWLLVGYVRTNAL